MGRVLISLLLLLAAIPSRAEPQRAGPQDFDRLFARALELQQSGDLMGAIDNYKSALTILPDRADALSNLGAAYVRLGQYEDGIKQYEAALHADPTGMTVRLNRALA